MQTSYSFEPFGNTSTSGSATTNSFAYTGSELDAGNLYFYRARYYHPQLERFVSEDPIGFNGGGPNFYAYTANSPSNLKDSSGLDYLTTYDSGTITVSLSIVTYGAGANSALADLWQCRCVEPK